MSTVNSGFLVHGTIDKFEELLSKSQYDDMEIITFLKYGWPVETSDVTEYTDVPPNQRGARESPSDLDSYVKAEIDCKGIIGPFDRNPFGRKARISPIDAIPKKDSADKRIILNLSFPPDGRSGERCH